MLDVGDGHRVYWECCGNPNGKSGLYLHGGPGSGYTAGARRFFDPDVYRVVLFDQRGSGRSQPLASEPDADLSTNTTTHLIADIEALRQHHGVESWTVLGMSWGTTLGLAYAQTHPQRVNGLVLALVTTTSRREVEWLTRDVGRIFPQEWDLFAAAVPETRYGTCRWSMPTPRCSSTISRPSVSMPPGKGVHGKMLTCPSLRAIAPTLASKTRNSACGSHAWSRTTGGTPLS